MADQGIKKVTVLKSILSSVDDNNNFVIRYRVISEDKSRVSHWSPIYTVGAQSNVLVPGDVNVIGNTVIASWGDETNRPSYDVFVGFNGATPTYHGTTPIHTYSFLKSGVGAVRVIVQVSSVNKKLSEAIEIYDSAEDGETSG